MQTFNLLVLSLCITFQNIFFQSIRSPSGQYSLKDLLKKNKDLQSEMRSLCKGMNGQKDHIQHLEKKAKVEEAESKRQIALSQKAHDTERAKYEKLIHDLKTELKNKDKERAKFERLIVDLKNDLKKSEMEMKSTRIAKRDSSGAIGSNNRQLPPRPISAKKEKQTATVNTSSRPLPPRPISAKKGPLSTNSSRPLPSRPSSISDTGFKREKMLKNEIRSSRPTSSSNVSHLVC